MVGGMSCSSPFAASFGWDEGLVMSHLGHVTRVVGNLGKEPSPCATSVMDCVCPGSSAREKETSTVSNAPLFRPLPPPSVGVHWGSRLVKRDVSPGKLSFLPRTQQCGFSHVTFFMD